MARTTKLQQELLRATQLRTRATHLYKLSENDWNDWELDWLSDQIQRPVDYIYSDKQWAVLEKLERNAHVFREYAELSVNALLDISYASRFDVDENDQDFVEKLYQRAPLELRRRQIMRLAGICRAFENIGYDDLVHAGEDGNQLADMKRVA